MKSKILLIYLCVNTLVLTGQTIICSKNTSKKLVQYDEIITAIKLYRSENPTQQDPLLLVDFMIEDSLNKYRIYPDTDVWAPIFRQPDCIVKIDSFAIAYLYTPEYRQAKDSLFLEILEQETSNTLRATIKYNWDKMTVNIITPPQGYRPACYDPSFKEYVFQNHILIKTNSLFEIKLFYEDTYIPPFYYMNYRVFDPRFNFETLGR